MARAGWRQGESSWVLGNEGMEALSQEALSPRVTPAAREGTGAGSLPNPAVSPRIQLLSGLRGRQKG